jgi:hypothetical protein
MPSCARRVVVSVSIDPELAATLRHQAAEEGLSFSAHVCDLLELARETTEVLEFVELLRALRTATASDDESTTNEKPCQR